jgi:hypothetical protein
MQDQRLCDHAGNNHHDPICIVIRDTHSVAARDLRYY